MFAAPIRIHARFETHVRAVVEGNDLAGSVLKKLRLKRRVFLWIPVDVPFQMNLLESIWRIAVSAARWFYLLCHSINLTPFAKMLRQISEPNLNLSPWPG